MSSQSHLRNYTYYFDDLQHVTHGSSQGKKQTDQVFDLFFDKG